MMTPEKDEDLSGSVENLDSPDDSSKKKAKLRKSWFSKKSKTLIFKKDKNLVTRKSLVLSGEGIKGDSDKTKFSRRRSIQLPEKTFEKSDKRKSKNDANNKLGGPSLPQSLQEDIIKFSLNNYSQIYFQNSQNKSHMFGKKIPKKFLQHTKTEIKESIIVFNSEELQQKAVDLFLHVMTYMGDRPIAKVPPDLASTILSDCVSTAELRDEFYCQVIKQTIKNPNGESEEKGWELFAMALEAFLPTQTFDNYLKSYFAKSAQECENIRIKQRATACFARLDELTKGPPRIPKVPSLELQKYSKDLPFMDSGFHVTLEDLFEKQGVDSKIPLVLKTLVNCIKEDNGYTLPNIFRNASSSADTLALKLDLEYHHGTLSQPLKSPHVAANTLKLWLKEIRSPVIPHSIYPLITQHSTNFSKLQEILSQLPEINKNILFYVINFLQVVASKQEVNRMTEEGLAVVVSPNLCRCPEVSLIKVSEFAKFETSFVLTLMTNLEDMGID